MVQKESYVQVAGEVNALDEPHFYGEELGSCISLIVEAAVLDGERSLPQLLGATWRGSGQVSSTNYSIISNYEDRDAKSDSD